MYRYSSPTQTTILSSTRCRIGEDISGAHFQEFPKRHLGASQVSGESEVHAPQAVVEHLGVLFREFFPRCREQEVTDSWLAIGSRVG